MWAEQKLILAALLKADRSVEQLMRLLEQHRLMRRLDVPKHPRKIVHVLVSQMNKNGYTIRSARHGDGSYRLEIRK